MFLSFISLNSQWKQAGNAEKLSSETTRIVNFVISEDNKSIYTLDFNSTISKWDYATGDSIWSRKIIPDSTKSHFSNWIFLSTDGKTYCTGLYSVPNITYWDFYIYDLESGNLIDSLILKTGLPDDFYISDFSDIYSIYLNYRTNTKELFSIFNFQYSHSNGPFDGGATSGMTNISTKQDSIWITKKLFDGTSNILIENSTGNILYFNISSRIWNSQGGYPGSYSNFEMDGNYFYKFPNDTLNNITYHERRSSGSKYEGTSTEKGFSLPVFSAFFENDNSHIYFSWLNNIYKYNVGTKDPIVYKAQSRYITNHEIQLYNTTSDKHFFVIIANRLNVHEILDYRYLNTYTVDSIGSIVLYKNSLDSDYIFLTDDKRGLYRISYKTLYLATGVETEDNQGDQAAIKISPNPVSDFIEISVGANGRSPLQSEFKIFNVYGQAVLSVVAIHELPLRVDVSSLAPGMYFVRIGDRVSKFVKI